MSKYLHEIENHLPMKSSLVNKYVYIKQNFIPSLQRPVTASKVLVNPLFNKKVFVNPNYKPNVTSTTSSGNIHINPNISSINISRENALSKIHINPKILKNVSTPYNSNSVSKKAEQKQNCVQHVTYSSKTKLIRTPAKEQTMQTSKRIRRSSVYTKFKIVKSSALNKSPEVKIKHNKLLFNSKYKLKRASTNKPIKSLSAEKTSTSTRYKLDNRRRILQNKSNKNTKFVFVNRFLSIMDVAKKVPLRTNKSVNLLNISGVIYKNSPNRLQRASMVLKRERKRSSGDIPNKTVRRTRYKFTRLSNSKSALPTEKKRRLMKNISSQKPKLSAEKLRKYNTPCPYYRKFGKCKGNDMGKCHRKHDPDQIALCTKFLQGACVDPKCLLSHNVSPEKMPTCKFYLEGSCSRDNCPYLHVKISPKADICKDFLEGFCKKASECDKRHQFLCPDFEKKGACQKPRCPYPHGRMVRKYSDFNKHKFAKKSSKNANEGRTKNSNKLVNDKFEENNEPEENNTAIRYYSDSKVEKQNFVESKSNDEVDSCTKINFRHRPQLGELPSFISLEDV